MKENNILEVEKVDAIVEEIQASFISVCRSPNSTCKRDRKISKKGIAAINS